MASPTSRYDEMINFALISVADENVPLRVIFAVSVFAALLRNFFLQSGRGDPSPTMRSKSRFPFDGKCSYFVRMCRFSGDIGYRRGKYGHLTSKRCCKSLVLGKTNLSRSAPCKDTARKKGRKCPICDFRLWQAVRRYREEPKIKHVKRVC